MVSKVKFLVITLSVIGIGLLVHFFYQFYLAFTFLGTMIMTIARIFGYLLGVR